MEVRLLEVVNFKMSLLVCLGRDGRLCSAWELSENCLEICFVGLVVGGNFVLGCLIIVVIFMELREAKRWGDALMSSVVVAMQATMEWGQFLW